MNLLKSITIIVLLFSFSANAQEKYEFQMQNQVKATPVKNQAGSGTCWSYSSLSFIESEILKNGKSFVDISEMYIVRMSYIDKAKLYVRMHGNLNFGGGGALHDAFNVMKNYGLVPQEAYQGLNYGTEKNNHAELDKVLKAYVESIIKSKKPTTAWLLGFTAILDSYLGVSPEKFTYNGKEYTPRTFSDEVVGLNSDDYYYFSSYTHHPFYEDFIMEVPDNWAWGTVYNLPLDEMMQVMENTVNSGYSIAWATDVSEKGFSSANAVAVIPEKDLTIMSKTEINDFLSEPVDELEITQEMRQKAFDNFETTDDHGMHITGIAKDKNGEKYFYVKNSWSEYAGEKGYYYFSDNFVKYKTMSFMVNKNAVPKEILKKMK